MNESEQLELKDFLEAQERAVTAVERQEWIDRVSEVMASSSGELLRRSGDTGQRVKSFLHGSWFGHPLHPALTDVPIGSWTAGVVFDLLDALTPRRVDRYGKAADTAIRVGVVGAVAAALAGLADWQYLRGRSQRIGTAHALLNSSALLTYVCSLSSRRRGHRAAGRLTGFLGYAIAVASAHLGGHLVYRNRAGVDHADRSVEPREFVPVLADSDLPENEPRRATAGEVRVVLVRRGGVIHALGEVCAHLGGPLAEGSLRDEGIVCPWHGSWFSLRDGLVLEGPASAPQPRFEARVREGMIEVRRLVE